MPEKLEKSDKEKFNTLRFLLRNIYMIFEFLHMQEENVKLLICTELIGVFCSLV